MERRAEKIAVITEQGRRVTYRELHREIQYCINANEALEGDFIQSSSKRYSGRPLFLLVCDNSFENLVIYLSCLRCKLPVILAGRQDENRLGELVKKFAVKYIWLPENRKICFGKPSGKRYGHYLLYRNESMVKYLRAATDLALLLPTSGSEGDSKLVMLSYDNIAANTSSIIEALNIWQDDRAAIMLPLCYSYGLSVVHTHLQAGAALLIPKSSMATPQFWRFLDGEHVTSLAGVPSVYELVRKLKILEGTYAFSQLRIMTQAGGALRLETQKYLLECLKRWDRKIHFAIMYGQTEATARITSFFLEEHETCLGSVGRVIPGGRLWIEGDGKQGEICYRGANVFMGYAQDFKDLVSDVPSKGEEHVLHTGDTGYLDEEGYLYVTGRKSRFAKVNGYRIGLDGLQEEVSRTLGCQVFCVGRWLEEREKIIFCWTDYTISVSEFEKILWKDRRLVGGFVLRPLESFPLKENGKVDYSQL